MSRHFDSSTITQMTKIMVPYRRPSCFFWTESVRSAFAALLWERQFQKILLQHGLAKVSNWECLFVHNDKGLSFLVYVDDRKFAGKNQNFDPKCKVLNKEVDLGEPTSFVDHVYLGCTQKTMWNKQWYCGQLKSHVWIEKCRGENRVASILWECSFFFMVLGYGRSCKEVCGTIFWVGKQDDSTTLQSIYSLHRWPPPQRSRNEICWRIVTSMLPNCSEMLKVGTNWKTSLFFDQ